MNYISIKKQSEVNLKGISTEFERNDSTIQHVILTDADGRKVKIAGSYGVTVYVPAPPKMIKKWELSGEVLKLPYSKLFNEKYEAEEERDRILDGINNNQDALLEIKELEVPEDTE